MDGGTTYGRSRKDVPITILIHSRRRMWPPMDHDMQVMAHDVNTKARN
jgi:hypothetical protein